MRTTPRRGACLLALLALVAAGCSSKSADEADDGGSPGPGTDGGVQEVNAVGVTDDTIKLSLIYGDLAALSEQNLAPEIGNAAEQAQAVVDDLNEKGGIAGREVELVPHVIEGTDAVLSPEVGRAACLAATQDDKPFAVIVAASVNAEVVRCTAIDQKTLTIAMDSFPATYFEEAEGRLFSVGSHLSIQRDRLYRAWPELLSEPAELEDKTIGIIHTDQPAEAAVVDGALKPRLEELGLDLAAEVTLPCPEGSQNCSQHDVAIQKMRDAGVDFVFLVAQTLAGSATVDAAKAVGYQPEWTTVGNNITKTVAQFFKNSKDTYDGAWGIDTGFQDFTDEARSCNDVAVAGGADTFEPGDDGFGYTAVTCLQIRTLADALDGAEGGAITLDEAIAAIEGLGEVPMLTDPKGTVGPGKHDEGDYVFLSRYSAASEAFEPYDDYEALQVT